MTKKRLNVEVEMELWKSIATVAVSENKTLREIVTDALLTFIQQKEEEREKQIHL